MRLARAPQDSRPGGTLEGVGGASGRPCPGAPTSGKGCVWVEGPQGPGLPCSAGEPGGELQAPGCDLPSFRGPQQNPDPGKQVVQLGPASREAPRKGTLTPGGLQPLTCPARFRGGLTTH